VAGHVEHHAADDDAVLPVLDGAEARAVERDLLLGIAAVPHRLIVPRWQSASMWVEATP